MRNLEFRVYSIHFCRRRSQPRIQFNPRPVSLSVHLFQLKKINCWIFGQLPYSSVNHLPQSRSKSFSTPSHETKTCRTWLRRKRSTPCIHTSTIHGGQNTMSFHRNIFARRSRRKQCIPSYWWPHKRRHDVGKQEKSSRQPTIAVPSYSMWMEGGNISLCVM